MKSIIVKSFRTDMAVRHGTNPNVPDVPATTLTLKHVDDTLHFIEFTPEHLRALKTQLDDAMELSPSIDERDMIESHKPFDQLSEETAKLLVEHPIMVHLMNRPPQRAAPIRMLPEHYVQSCQLVTHLGSFEFRFSMADRTVTSVSFFRSLLPYLCDDLIRVSNSVSGFLTPH